VNNGHRPLFGLAFNQGTARLNSKRLHPLLI
jgi:hypothetical protein